MNYLESFTNFATGTGFLVIFILFPIIVWKLIQGLRLYVFSQLCCQVNFKEKYGQWAVISGATDGIGLAMAKELARRGMSIVLIGRNDNKLAATKVMLEKEANVGEVVTVKIDLSDSSLENFESIRSQIDPDNRDIGLLINNAGSWPLKLMRFNNYDMDYITRLVNLNILSSLHLTRMIMPGMLDRGKGLLVNVSSVVGYFPTPYVCLYGASKAFLNSFSRQLQIEYSGHPVDIINLTPNFVQTTRMERTWNLRTTSIFNPTPDDYAKSALNAISTKISSISGTMFHGISTEASRYFYWLAPYIYNLNLRLVGTNYDVSPVPRRRN